MLQSLHLCASLTHLLTTAPSSLTVSLSTTRGSSTLLEPPTYANAWRMGKNTTLMQWRNDEEVRELEGVAKNKKQMSWKDCRFLTNLFGVALRWGQVRGRPLTTVLCQRPFTLHHHGPFNTTDLTLVHCLLSGSGKSFAVSKCHLDQKNDSILSNLTKAEWYLLMNTGIIHTSVCPPSLFRTVLFTTLGNPPPSCAATDARASPSNDTSSLSTPSSETHLRIILRVIWRDHMWDCQEQEMFSTKHYFMSMNWSIIATKMYHCSVVKA